MHTLSIRVLCLLVVITFLQACNSNKKAAVNEKSSTEMAAVKTDVPVVEEKVEAPTTVTTTKSSSVDSLFAFMERTPCYGRCPIYKMWIYKSGYVLYEGINFVEREGVWTTQLSTEDLQQIASKGKEIDYFNLDDEYDSPITDIPACITTLNIDGRKKTVRDRHNAPAALREFEKLIDAVVEKKQWKMLKPKEGDY